ncbi:MAG: sigma-54 dependent transcriptional regulator [Tenuifilaceae bacterium]|jgi:DNA-binding NtrC family response regulator|nr:sigma-54 dependent transcriptional regulator [Tenuifilaceae bacterium]
MHKLLIVDDEQSVRYSFKKVFGSTMYNVKEASSAEEAIGGFKLENPDLVILDIEMPGKDGIQVLRELKQISPQIPIIIITAYGTGDRVINAMKYGAFDYIEKPFDIPRLKAIIEDAISTSKKSKSIPASDLKKIYQKNVDDKNIMVGESPAIKDVFKLIGKVATSDANILVVGESGTGKELVAKAIHKYSDRLSKPFIAINCAAIPETLLESELFGYEKGAFTGADKYKPGKFEDANGGTLFLDEIGDMSLPIQSKLLRVLQEGTIERLGSSKPVKVDVRIVAATNRNLEKDISTKSFREDLYYRLKVITISLPPLRMRKDDIPILVNHFLQKHSRNPKGEVLTIQPEALNKLIEHTWPGNIRELENVIKRAVILAKGSTLGSDFLFDEVEIPGDGHTDDSARLFAYLSPKIMSENGKIYKLAVEEFEKDLLLWALSETNRNQVQAAKLLGISRVMLHERLDKFIRNDEP